MLNAGNEDAHVEITISFLTKTLLAHKITVPAQRTLHLRFNDLKKLPVPLETNYSSVIVSDYPIVVSNTRLDSRQAENALISTIAYAE